MPAGSPLPPGWPAKEPARAAADGPPGAARQRHAAPATPVPAPPRAAAARPDVPKLPVAVLGATGVVGQRFVERLQTHPFFQIRALVGNESAGKVYGAATPWQPETPLQEAVARMKVVGMDEVPAGLACVFSAIPSGVAGPAESRLAAAGHKVFTNARDHRMDPDVPLLVPELNADHLPMVRRQEGPGFIVANGNCSSIIAALAMAPLHRAYGIEEAHATTLQGLSGAGYPGVSALDVLDNVVPHIPGEEEKLAREPLKMLGTLEDGRVRDAAFPIHATTTRVPVREGHTVVLHLRLGKATTADDVAMALRRFSGPSRLQKLPTAPTRPILVRDEPDRPQPRRDRDAGKGMSVTVGRIRAEPATRTVRMVALGHNAVRGAAGQAIMDAEYAFTEGYL